MGKMGSRVARVHPKVLESSFRFTGNSERRGFSGDLVYVSYRRGVSSADA